MSTSVPPPLVLHVIHHLVVGGMENGLVNIINGTPPERYRHAIACVEDFSDFRQRIKRDDVPIFALRRSRIGVWGLRRALYRLCGELRPTILHSRNMSGLDAPAPARMAGVRHCVHGEHGWDVNDLDGQKFKPAFMRRLHRPFIDRYITVSQHLRRYLMERVGVPDQRITQIYNGVDTNRFAPRPGARERILPREFATAESIVIGAVGRIQPVKNQELLLRSFAQLTSQREDLAARVRLAIIGDGPLLARLRETAASLGLRDRVWLPGSMTNVPEILSTFDVFVLPSLSEGISNTILEAMASGLPVVASGVGGNGELVEPGRTGALFESADLAGLTRLLIEYASDASRRKSEGATARATATSRFALRGMIDNYLAVYDQVQAQRRAP